MRNWKYKCIRSSYLFDYEKLSLRLFVKLSNRSFSSTPIRKGDPIGSLISSFAIPYAASLLSNPLGGAFILLIGMATTLFFLTLSLPGFFAHNPEYVLILQRLDNIFLLYETFITYEQSGIDILLVNIDNFSPETLGNYYLLFQELVTIRESLFSLLSNLVNSPQIEFLEQPTVDRINQILEDLRLGGNNLMSLIRNIEGRLNIAEEERIPPFWFEG